MDEFGDLYEGFELASDDGESVLLDIDIDEQWAKVITEVAKKNISTPEVQITGYVDITSYKSNGVEVIREALQSIENDNVEVQCVGAPKYRIMVTAQDYPTAEKILRESADNCIEIVENNDGEGSFHRELEDN
jgi:translation initiation factor 2 subunit 1